MITLEDLKTMIAAGDDVTGVDTSAITNMSELFKDNTTFNQDISGWDVHNVSNMQDMFWRASVFNQDIGSWDVGRVTNMESMFYEAFVFNQDISSWNVKKVASMYNMFYDASNFNQDLSSWNISRVQTMMNMFYEANLSPANYDAILLSWSTMTVKTGVFFNAGKTGRFSIKGGTAKEFLTDTYGWRISDGGLDNTSLDTRLNTTEAIDHEHFDPTDLEARMTTQENSIQYDTETSSILLGDTTSSNGTQQVAIGDGASVAGSGTTAIGRGAKVTGNAGTAIGNLAIANTGGFAIGNSANAGNLSVAIGNKAKAAGSCLAFGDKTDSGSSTAAKCVAIGASAKAQKSYEIRLGGEVADYDDDGEITKLYGRGFVTVHPNKAGLETLDNELVSKKWADAQIALLVARIELLEANHS